MREAELDKIGGGFWRLGMRLDGLLQQRHGGLFPLEIQGELCDVRHEFWLARIPLQEAQVVRQGIADLSRSFEIPGRQVMSQRTACCSATPANCCPGCAGALASRSASAGTAARRVAGINPEAISPG